MQKIFVLLGLCLLMSVRALAADDGCAVTFWFNTPESVVNRNVEGVKLGIPLAVGDANVRGAELAIFYNEATLLKGFQFAWIGGNWAGKLQGCQLGFINLIGQREETVGVQLGFYNQSAKGGIQIGFLNNGLNDSFFQFGLININKNGLLPIMIFVNFSHDFFN